MNKNDTIERKIRDYFNGNLLASEEAELINWLKLNKQNQEYFISFKESLNPQDIEHPLLQSSFAELKNKLLIDRDFNSKLSGRVRRLQISFSRIAAILIIAVVTGFSLAYLMLEIYKPNANVVWFETHVPRGEKAQLLLPDGSRVWVNSDSNISYPSNFMEGNREVKLNGEAYFEVEKFEHKSFTVKTNDYDINVLGTKFNVMAYPDFNRTETSLIEGKIEIKKGEQNIPVAPGETFTFSNKQFSVIKNNTRLTSRWKNNIFDFDQITFKEMVIRLERWYDVDIEIENPELNNVIYSGIFKNEETIWQVLNTVQLTIPIKFTRVDFRKFSIEINKKK